MTKRPHPGFENWTDYILHLEGQIEGLDDPVECCEMHMAAARLWEDKFLQKAKAIAHYQQAFKAKADSADALREARRVYWEMGRLPTLEKILSLEFEIEEDPAGRVALHADA